VDYKPETTVEHGVKQFVNWYREYYKIWVSLRYRFQAQRLTDEGCLGRRL
jgi:dTDP-D-glucose 4,6-dehydratase